MRDQPVNVCPGYSRILFYIAIYDPACVCVCACDARKKVYISVYIYIYVFILYFLLTFEKKDDENCTLPVKRGGAEL